MKGFIVKGFIVKEILTYVKDFFKKSEHGPFKSGHYLPHSPVRDLLRTFTLDYSPSAKKRVISKKFWRNVEAICTNIAQGISRLAALG